MSKVEIRFANLYKTYINLPKTTPHQLARLRFQTFQILSIKIKEKFSKIKRDVSADSGLSPPLTPLLASIKQLLRNLVLQLGLLSPYGQRPFLAPPAALFLCPSVAKLHT